MAVPDSRSCASESFTTLRDQHHKIRGRARNAGQIQIQDSDAVDSGGLTPSPAGRRRRGV
jgi:hypothetical protein